MKKYQKIWSVLSLLLFVLAVVSGGGGMAAAGDLTATQIGDEGGDVATHTDVDNKEVVEEDKSDRQSPGGEHDGQNLTGTQASATQMREGGLEEEEREETLTQLKPYRVPFMRLLGRVAKERKVQNYAVKHARVGGETLDGTITAAIAAGDSIELTKNNFSGNLGVFRKFDTIAVPSMGGYKPGSQTEHDGNCLVLEVVERTKTKLTLMAINGPAATAGQVNNEMEDCTVPAIPAGTYVLGMANAMSESQLLVTPDNFQPREKEVYLQKKGWNVLFTEEFEKMKKKYPFKVKDLLRDASILNDVRIERSYWMGVMAKKKRVTEDGAIEDVFYSEGILPQIPNYYAIGSEYMLSDLVAISKLQFTDFATSNRSFAFCGKNAIERLENIDPGKNREIHFSVAKDFDLTFRRFTDTFGEINFVWDQTLDFMGKSDYMFVLDLDNAIHYIKEGKRNMTNDMSKGAGDIRLAKRHIEIMADAVGLKGYNSIIVGPEDKMFGDMTQGIVNWIVSSNHLPKTPAKNMKIALTSDVTVGEGAQAVTYEKGSVLIYNGTAWETYTGSDLAA